jgi:hypothetical protein
VSSTSQLVNNTESFVVKTNKCGQILGHYCLERKRYGRGPICIVVTRCGPHVMSSSPLESVPTFSSTKFCRTHIYWTRFRQPPSSSSESQGNFESRTEDRQDPEQHFSFDLSDHVPGRLIDSVGHFFGRFLSHLSFRWFISGETKSPRYLSSTRYAVSTDNATERNSLIISPIAPIVLRATIKTITNFLRPGVGTNERSRRHRAADAAGVVSGKFVHALRKDSRAPFDFGRTSGVT